MQPDRANPQDIRNLASVLTGCATKATQCEIPYVFALLNSNLTNRIRHIFDGNSNKTSSYRGALRFSSSCIADGRGKGPVGIGIL